MNKPRILSLCRLEIDAILEMLDEKIESNRESAQFLKKNIGYVDKSIISEGDVAKYLRRKISKWYAKKDNPRPRPHSKEKTMKKTTKKVAAKPKTVKPAKKKK